MPGRGHPFPPRHHSPISHTTTKPRPARTTRKPSPGTSSEDQTYVVGHPDPITTWHDDDDVWMPWKAYIPAHGNLEGWSAIEAARKAAASINPPEQIHHEIPRPPAKPPTHQTLL